MPPKTPGDDGTRPDWAVSPAIRERRAAAVKRAARKQRAVASKAANKARKKLVSRRPTARYGTYPGEIHLIELILDLHRDGLSVMSIRSRLEDGGMNAMNRCQVWRDFTINSIIQYQLSWPLDLPEECMK